MAKRAVEVRECDRCGKEPANTWRITGPDGLLREIELCDQHGAPVANAYALARPVSTVMPRSARARSGTGTGTGAGTGTRPFGNGLEVAPKPEPIWR
jgi:hypothetical protein